MTSNQNKNERPMYCKEKIYCGIDEFTFEELRAFKWKKDQEQKKQADDKKDLEGNHEEIKPRFSIYGTNQLQSTLKDI